MIRFTEAEAIRLGCKKDKHGNWECPRGGSVPKQAEKPRDEDCLLCKHSREMLKPEPSVGSVSQKETGNEEKGKGKSRKSDLPRVVVTITAYRVRRIDPDNIYTKHIVDGLVNLGVITDDTSAVISRVIKSCIKVDNKAQEHTRVCIWDEGAADIDEYSKKY